MNKLTLSIFVTVLCTLAFCAVAQAQIKVTFVSMNGNDGNTCLGTSAATACRTFQRAHNVVSSGGTVVAADSGGYGKVIVTKSVTITGEGVYAGITATSGDAITIATAGITVTLRSLNIQGSGLGTNGINVTKVGNLHVEGCVINGFFNNGILVNLAADGSYIFIKDTITRNNAVSGIQIQTSTGTVRASIDNCRSERNAGDGFFASFNSRVTINRSVASGNGSPGFNASSDVSGATAELSCEECVSSNNTSGFAGQGNSGLVGTIRVSHSTATNNIFGFLQSGSGVFNTLGNNLVRGNAADTSGTITPIKLQ